MKKTECLCEDCREGCTRRPGWMTPQQAQALIDAGFSDRLMLDWWVGDETRDTIAMLAPAIHGHEGIAAPPWPTGRCTFLNAEGLCDVHGPHKPEECQVATCQPEPSEDYTGYRRNVIVDSWDCDEGRELVKKWAAQHGISAEFEPTMEGALEILMGLLGRYNHGSVGEEN